MSDSDKTVELVERISAAARDGTPLIPQGSASKSFLGRLVQGEALSVGAHRGVVSYQPTELTITARAGTPLAALEQVLSEDGQMLPFEPPHFGPQATLGGTIAAGLSGPARPYRGAARDFVLGTRVVNGRGEALRFGGEVMKNVAGFDLSRLLTGSMGTLGVLLDVSLKVLPRPQLNVTRHFHMDAATAIETMNAWAARPLPLSAACHLDDVLRVRLSGSEAGVAAAIRSLGGDDERDGDAFWHALREHRLSFFDGAGDGTPLWRVSVPPASASLVLPGRTLIDWGGAIRWLRCDADADSVRSVATSAGGHAMLFRGGDRRGEVNHPLDANVLRLHQRLKKAFDPKGIFSPGRLYAEF